MRSMTAAGPIDIDQGIPNPSVSLLIPNNSSSVFEARRLL